VWVAPLRDIAGWWRERHAFRLSVTPLGDGRWQVEAECTARAGILARHLAVEDADTSAWHGADRSVEARRFVVRAERCPAVAVAPDTPWDVVGFLREQGYPIVTASADSADAFATYVELPEGLGETREEQRRWRVELVRRIEQTEAPLVRFTLWPAGQQAALSITGDIDSVTIQDFFLRILEVRGRSEPSGRGEGISVLPQPRAAAVAAPAGPPPRQRQRVG
jgi:hypothetical protein